MGTYTKAQLETELTRIKNAVASCRTAIYNQGVLNIPSDVTLAQLPTYVNMIDCSHPDILLEYLQADETPSSASRTSMYFDTQYYPDSSTNIEIKYQNTFAYSPTATGSSYVILGCNHTTGGGASFSGDYYFASPAGPTGSATSSLAWRYRNNSNVFNTNAVIDTNIHTISEYNSSTTQYIYYDGVLTTGTSSSLKTFERTLYIFALHSNTAAFTSSLKGTRIYYIKIWKNKNLERFYIPVLHWNGSSYVPCFYDKVNDSYIYKQGTGTIVYAITDDIMLDYIYVPTSNRGVYYNTNWSIELHQHMDIKYISGNVIAGGSINEGPMLGSTYSGTYKYGIYAPAAGAASTKPTVKNGFKIPRTSSTVQLYGTTYSASDTSTHTVSVFSDNSNYRCMYDNLTLYTSTIIEQTNPIIGTKLGIFGGTSATTGSMQSSFLNSKIFYACVADKQHSSSQSWIPVLHNNVPVFYDLKSQTYISNSGSQTPGYEKLN